VPASSQALFFYDGCLIYPLESHIVLLDTANRKQNFFHLGKNSGGASCAALCQGLGFLAVAERGRDGPPTVSIIDLRTLKRKKILSVADVNATVGSKRTHFVLQRFSQA
jgi:cilia- and flagella-associated protein 57